MLDMNKFVSRQELMQETGICNTTISKYLRDLGMYHRGIPKEKKQEIVDYINERVRQARENSNRARLKGKSVYDRKLSVRRNTPCNWRVVLLGEKGWLVIRTGTQEEMAAWARMLRDNGFVAEAAENKYRTEA